MNRRHFVKAAVSTGALVVVGGAITLSARDSSALTIAAAVDTLHQLRGKEIVTESNEWDAAHVLVHCASSVECSIVGYPEHKPEWFKQTVGPLAFNAFNQLGSMRHDTTEEVPGADRPTANTLVESLDYAIKTYEDFASYDGPLQEHFAYGKLSRREYEIAHVLHLFDHLDTFSRNDGGEKEIWTAPQPIPVSE